MNSPLLDLLHMRILDRIACPMARKWLLNHATLDASSVEGWPVLVLRLNIPTPGNLPVHLIRGMYSEAAISKKSAGPMADMGHGLIVEPVQ